MARQKSVKGGNDSHREEEDRLEQRKEAWRLYNDEHWSYRDIATKFDIAVSTARDDVIWYTNYLANELPQTFEAWRIRVIKQYEEQYEKAKNLLETSGSAMVQATALRQMTDITSKLADVTGLSKGIEPPKKSAEVEDKIEWGI